MAARRAVQAFVDESVRGRGYLVACACIEARHLTPTADVGRHEVSLGVASGPCGARRHGPQLQEAVAWFQAQRLDLPESSMIGPWANQLPVAESYWAISDPSIQ
jgi:hypothetical protein